MLLKVSLIVKCKNTKPLIRFYQETIKPFKDLPMSTETLKKIAPTLQMSDQFLYELTRGIDCMYPRDLSF